MSINLNLLLKGNVELQDFCSGRVLHITDKGQVESRPKVLPECLILILIFCFVNVVDCYIVAETTKRNYEHAFY